MRVSRSSLRGSVPPPVLLLLGVVAAEAGAGAIDFLTGTRIAGVLADIGLIGMVLKMYRSMATRTALTHLDEKFERKLHDRVENVADRAQDTSARVEENIGARLDRTDETCKDLGRRIDELFQRLPHRR